MKSNKKKIIILSLGMIVFINLSAQSYILNYTDSTGMKQGLWEEKINKNDLDYALLNYKDNKKDGTYKVFYSNGKIAVSGLYKNDSLNGQVLNYFKEGRLKIESYYKDNKLDGCLKEYWENGKIKSIKCYKSDDVIPGSYKEYYETGHIYIDTKFDQNSGAVIMRFYHSNGNLASEGKKKDGNIIGIWKEFSEEGLPSKELIYEKGRLIETRKYDKNGTVIKKE